MWTLMNYGMEMWAFVFLNRFLFSFPLLTMNFNHPMSNEKQKQIRSLYAVWYIFPAVGATARNPDK